MTVKLPTISVIVPTFNSQDNISNCLKALENQTLNRNFYEVIVVDDGSTDRTCEIVKTFPNVRLVESVHGGPSEARNLGAKMASGEYLLFTDSDCTPTSKWIKEITSYFTDVNIIGVKGVYQSNQKSVVARFVQLEYQYKYQRMARDEFIDFIDTSSAAYRRDVFLKNGGFDTSFTRASVEDQELSFRLNQKGYHMVFAPGAAVFHQHDQDILDYWRRKYGIGYWKAYMLRWLPQKTFSDSHTPISQRLQIGFLGLAVILFFGGFFVSQLMWGSLIAFCLFILSGFPFWFYVVKNDFLIAIIYPFVIIIRATALGLGLLVGFLVPPKEDGQKRKTFMFGAFFIKRLFDILVSIIGLVIFSPVLLVASIFIVLDSPGPALFYQWRAGENGKPFRMIKLRTMVNGAEKQLSELIPLNSLKGPAYKIPNDPRVTRPGRWLRRWSIDEIPQFWNILKGDMSLVGPRPEELWVVKCYSDEQRKRLVVKPGLTGPMQVSGRGDLDFDERLELELDYIQKYSMLKDLGIILRSLKAIINGKGAY